MLLSHRLLLFCGLYNASFGTEILHSATENSIFSKLTLQAPVEHRNFNRRLEPYLFKAFLTITQYPGIVPHEFMFQSFANHLVRSEQIGCGDTLSIRWVCDDDAWL